MRRQLFAGHCLLVPKTHYEVLDDLLEDVLLIQGVGRGILGDLAGEHVFDHAPSSARIPSR